MNSLFSFVSATGLYCARVMQIYLFAISFLSMIATTMHAQEDDFRNYFPQIESAGWEEISRGCPIEHIENETLKQILYGIENVPEKFWKTAAESNPAKLADAIAAPEEYCGKVFSVSGKCVSVPTPWNIEHREGGHSMPLPRDEHLSFSQRMQVTCADEINIWVLADSLPSSAWYSYDDASNRFAGQPVSAYGMFLFVQDGTPVFVARQVQWRPIRLSPELNIGPGQLELSRAGFNVALLDMARNYTDMALMPQEKELFDEILIAAKTISQQPDFTLQGLAEPFDLVGLVQDPVDHAGALIQVDGSLWRYTSIAIDDPEVRKMLGEDQYFQLDVFVPLGNKRIHIGDDTHHNPIEVSGEYGITVITSSLPEEILNARLPVQIEVPAFMLKVWEHKSLATSTAPGTARRPSPILIAIPNQLRMAPPSEIASELFILIPSIGFGVLGILGILFFVTRNRAQSFHGQQRGVDVPDFAVLFNGKRDESPPSP